VPAYFIQIAFFVNLSAQSRRFLNANYANQRMTRINPRKFAKFAYSWHSRSKPAGLSSDFGKTMFISPWLSQSRRRLHDTEKNNRKERQDREVKRIFFAYFAGLAVRQVGQALT